MDDNNNQQPPPTSAVIPPPPPGSIPGGGTPFHYHHPLHQQQLQQLKTFWAHQRTEIENSNDFKNHQLPLARIKKIMKADEDVRMISAEAPILFAKACELFILELTIRSWLHAEENKRRTLQKNDIAAAITRTEIFDFLVDIVPREEVKEEEEGGEVGLGGVVVGNVPYYYNAQMMGGQQQQPVGMGMMGGGGVYGQVAPSQAWQSVWQNNGGDDVSYGSGGGSGNVDHQG
ncbi:unnamed protein product [Eruca vesicaria subsp. sativa]|uniref:Core Histone H2A/H2B/H3 domain-containing protein n=1 Tax=Eruca vesicaria subsp. sativa TaxID=29727 RepID=A0ABC8JNI3_ERUVS|nr:unnamed protein product [Eruca vesicaria subsp. sativa]